VRQELQEQLARRLGVEPPIPSIEEEPASWRHQRGKGKTIVKVTELVPIVPLVGVDARQVHLRAQTRFGLKETVSMHAIIVRVQL
jgi:hypothetical protein